MGTGKKAAAAAATIAALALVGVTPANADQGKGVCPQTAQGSTTIGAGDLTSTRTLESHGTSQDFGCVMPDPTIHSAKEVWSQSGTFTCGPPEEKDTGTDTFTWDNGRTSVLKYNDHLVGDVDYTDGYFVSGEFKGMHLTWLGSGLPSFADPLKTLGVACALGKQQTFPAGYTGNFYLR